MLEKYYVYVFIISFLCLCGMIWIHGHNKDRKFRKYILWVAIIIFIIQIGITAVTFPLVEKFDENSQKLIDFVNNETEMAYKEFGDIPKKIRDLGSEYIEMDNPDYNMTTVTSLQTFINMQNILNQVVDKTAHEVHSKI